MLQRIMSLFRPKTANIISLPELHPVVELGENKLFFEVLKEYVEKYKVENDLSEETKAHYDVYVRNTHMFMAVNKLQDLKISEIKIHHAESFRTWLKINLKTCTLRRASRHVELLKRVTKYAVSMEYIVNDYLSPIKAQRDKPKKIVHLELNEIKKIKVYKFHSDILRIVADLFLFQCFTGLSYSDIYKYEIVERNGKLWIEGDRTKSDEEYVVYFFPEAKEILDKYQGRLPKLSNQKYNEYLKELAGLLNIKKHLTTHVGRKTHATILALRGAGTKPISIQLGNTERVCNESYISNTHAIVEGEILRLGLENGLLLA